MTDKEKLAIIAQLKRDIDYFHTINSNPIKISMQLYWLRGLGFGVGAAVMMGLISAGIIVHDYIIYMR